jgi:parallel beta-helix repeat protein
MTRRHMGRGSRAAIRISVTMAGLGLAGVAVPPEADAACAGTAVSPTQDLAAVVAAGAVGETFCLRDGQHRLTAAVIAKQGQTIKAKNRRRATIIASRRLTGWTRALPNGWRATVPGLAETTNGGAPGDELAQPEELYREDVVQNAAFLEKIGVTLSDGTTVGAALSTLGPGESFVDYQADAVYVGSDPTGRALELTSLTDAIQSTAPSVRVIGVRVKGANAAGIRLIGADALVDDVEVLLNSDRGIRLNGDRSRLEDSYIHHNGVFGVNSSFSTGAVFARLEVAYNDQKGMRSRAGVCNASGGSKFSETVAFTLLDSSFHHNLCNAVWFDINNTGAVVQGVRATDNTGGGIVYEISYDGTITGNTISRNTEYGVLVRGSSGVEIASNRISGNGARLPAGGDLVLLGVNRLDHPSPLGPHLTRDNDVHHNTVASTTKVGVISKADPDPAALFDPTSNRFRANDYDVASCTTGTTFQWNGPQTWTQWRAVPQDADAEASCV